MACRGRWGMSTICSIVSFFFFSAFLAALLGCMTNYQTWVCRNPSCSGLPNEQDPSNYFFDPSSSNPTKKTHSIQITREKKGSP